jgi:glycosyltransferase involved in cell wall biosynthesis
VNRKKKIVVIINDIIRAQEHEWYVMFINRSLFDLEFVLVNSEGSPMDQFLKDHGIPVYHFNSRGKKDLIRLTFRLYLLIRKIKPDIVHTHLFESSLAGLTAARIARVKKRIMTRHYSDYHHIWFPSAVKYDRYLNKLATQIVAISKNVERILVEQENVPEKKVMVIHHGLNMPEYAPGAVSEERIEAIKSKYRIKEHQPVIGTISRFTELKGLQYLIPAFGRLLLSYPNAVLVMANASGDYENEISRLLTGIPENSYRRIKFEEDIAALYRVFDCFVHLPITATAEAFGQTYIEALASKVPSVFTLSGVAPEFAVDHTNCLVVPFKDSDSVYEKMNYILSHPTELKPVVQEGYQNVMEKFSFTTKMNKLERLYSGDGKQ